jgi:hypothetical protein
MALQHFFLSAIRSYWIHTLEVRIIVMSYWHARLSHCHGIGGHEIAGLFFFLQFAPGASGSWIHTLELRIIVMSHCHARLSPCHAAGDCVIATLYNFHNLFLGPLVAGFKPSNLESLGD